MADGAQDFTNAVTYTVSAEDNQTTQDWTVTVTVRPLGINGNEVSVYPNPTNGAITIIGTKEAFVATIRNLEGKMIKRTNQKLIDLTDEQNGLYLVQVETKSGHHRLFKVLKNN